MHELSVDLPRLLCVVLQSAAASTALYHTLIQ